MTRRDESSFISPKMHLPPPHPEEACKRSWASLKNRSFQKIDPGEPNGPDTKEVVSVSIPLHSSAYWPLIILFWPQTMLTTEIQLLSSFQMAPMLCKLIWIKWIYLGVLDSLSCHQVSARNFVVGEGGGYSSLCPCGLSLNYLLKRLPVMSMEPDSSEWIKKGGSVV